MSKQKKTKQPPVLGRLLAYAGGHKWLSVLGCGLSGVSAAAAFSRSSLSGTQPEAF